MDMHGGASGGCKMQEIHPHESRCLRRRQYRLLFILGTLSCALGPASRQDTSLVRLLTHVKKTPIGTIHPEATLSDFF